MMLKSLKSLKPLSYNSDDDVFEEVLGDLLLIVFSLTTSLKHVLMKCIMMKPMMKPWHVVLRSTQCNEEAHEA